jgi:hypothetical protein
VALVALFHMKQAPGIRGYDVMTSSWAGTEHECRFT